MYTTVESPQSGITVLRLTGMLDRQSVPEFRPLLATQVEHSRRGLILTLAAVQFMDSAGVAVLIEGLKWSRARALPYVLAELPATVRMVIELARLENFFTIVAGIDEAVALITHPTSSAG